MGILDNLTRKVKIIKYVGLLHYSQQLTNVAKVKDNIKRRYTVSPQWSIPGVSSIVLDDHSIDRWNERVGPIVTCETLTQNLNHLLFASDRFHLRGDGSGLIDRDIVFTYYLKDQILHITTFYGRISLNPSLTNFEQLRTYNKEMDFIKLSIPIHILQEQILPPIPKQMMLFKGRDTFYRLEEYDFLTQEQPILFLTKVRGFEAGFIFEIDLNKVNQPLLNRSVLYALRLMGYSNFVLRHLEYHKPENVALQRKKQEEWLLKKITMENSVM